MKNKKKIFNHLKLFGIGQFNKKLKMGDFLNIMFQMI